MHLTAQHNINLKESKIVDSHRPIPLNPPNNYYDKFADATQNIKLHDCKSLNEIFVNKEIYHFISLMFKVLTDLQEWDDYVLSTAWRNKSMIRKCNKKTIEDNKNQLEDKSDNKYTN